jgi:hypothetical protein
MNLSTNTTASTFPSGNALSTEQLRMEDILAALKGIRYGSVEFIIHDERVVQIDRHERIRLNRG